MQGIGMCGQIKFWEFIWEFDEDCGIDAVNIKKGRNFSCDLMGGRPAFCS
jgi:hypothetical protein